MIALNNFKDYFFENKKLYRKAYRVKCKGGDWQYREQREIKQISNNGVRGYLLRDKKNKRVFVSLTKIKFYATKEARKAES